MSEKNEPKKADESLKKEEVKETAKTKTEKVSKVEELEKKVKELEEQNAQIKDQMLRHQADLENYKKRLIREKEDAVSFANTKIIEELLEFMDNLERAIESGRKTDDKDGFIKGIELIESQLMGALNKNWGLCTIETVGKEFNPQEHEAYMMTVDPKLEVETVLDEFQKGYKLHDRVIRPAKVRVGKPE